MGVVVRVANPKRFEIYFAALDPAVGHEIQKTRPCVIVSPDDINPWLGTVIIAPYTSSARRYPFRMNSRLKNKQGQIALDQMRVVDKARLIKYVGTLSDQEGCELLAMLQTMFAY